MITLYEKSHDHVPPSGDTDNDKARRNNCLTDDDLRHRAEFAEFAREKGHEQYRDLLARLYTSWEEWNRDFFEGKLAPPHILLSEPKNPKALGDHALLSGWGSTNQTRIRPSILDGKHPGVRAGNEYAEGRFLLARDILLHESVHQYQFEVLGEFEESYRGHGPKFRDLCNGIGVKLDLPMVRTAKARGKDRDLPSCSDWPIGVRPKGYYLGAYIANSEEMEVDDDDGEAAPEPPQVFAKWIADNPEHAALLARIVENITALLDRFFEEFKVPPIVMDQAVLFIAKSYRHRRRANARRPTAPPATTAALPAAE